MSKTRALVGVEQWPPFLSTTEAGERLNADPQTIRALINAGKLRAIRVGREYRIRATWIEEFIDRQSRR